MPNGVNAVSTRSIDEGRSSRIADYTKHGGREPTNRSRSTLRASNARARAAVKRRVGEAHSALANHGKNWVRGAGEYRNWLNYKAPSDRQIRRSITATGLHSIKPKAKKKAEVAPVVTEIRKKAAKKRSEGSRVRRTAKKYGL